MHRLDAAHLFRLALEQAPAGSVLHAVADEGVPIRDVADVIGRHLGPARWSPSPPSDAAGHFGFLAGLLALDGPASSALTRELLGWQPTHPGLIDDLDKGHYFATVQPPDQQPGKPPGPGQTWRFAPGPGSPHLFRITRPYRPGRTRPAGPGPR